MPAPQCNLCAAGATIKGCTRVGLRLLVFTVHPMQAGATLMSSFLFNVALVLLTTNAAIQFCAQAFALYANETAIHDIWGNQVGSPIAHLRHCREQHVHFLDECETHVLLVSSLNTVAGRLHLIQHVCTSSML